MWAARQQARYLPNQDADPTIHTSSRLRHKLCSPIHHLRRPLTNTYMPFGLVTSLASIRPGRRPSPDHRYPHRLRDSGPGRKLRTIVWP